jgi:hypothetical protein
MSSLTDQPEVAGDEAASASSAASQGRNKVKASENIKALPARPMTLFGSAGPSLFGTCSRYDYAATKSEDEPSGTAGLPSEQFAKAYVGKGEPDDIKKLAKTTQAE